jgi:hypothetical protein
MPIPTDEWSLPDGLQLLNYPPPYQNVLRENTSLFMVKNNEIERAGRGEAVISYESTKTE